MKALFLAVAMTMAAVNAGAAMRTLACGARVSDDMEKPKRLARNEWALPRTAKSAPAQLQRAVGVRAADSQSDKR